MTCVLRGEFLEKVKPKQTQTSMMDALMRRNSFNLSFSKLWHPNSEKTGGRSKSGSFGSSVAIQKLRESKWFDRGEERIFCAVIEAGFIVELRHPETGESWFGVTAVELKKCEWQSVCLSYIVFRMGVSLEVSGIVYLILNICIGGSMKGRRLSK